MIGVARIRLTFLNPDNARVALAVIHGVDSGGMSDGGVIRSKSNGRVCIVHTDVLGLAAARARFAKVIFIALEFVGISAKSDRCVPATLIRLDLVVEVRLGIGLGN